MNNLRTSDQQLFDAKIYLDDLEKREKKIKSHQPETDIPKDTIPALVSKYNILFKRQFIETYLKQGVDRVKLVESALKSGHEVARPVEGKVVFEKKTEREKIETERPWWEDEPEAYPVITENEKNCLRLVRGKNWTYDRAAKKLNLSPGLVESYIRSAEAKRTIIEEIEQRTAGTAAYKHEVATAKRPPLRPVQPKSPAKKTPITSASETGEKRQNFLDEKFIEGEVIKFLNEIEEHTELNKPISGATLTRIFPRLKQNVIEDAIKAKKISVIPGKIKGHYSFDKTAAATLLYLYDYGKNFTPNESRRIQNHVNKINKKREEQKKK